MKRVLIGDPSEALLATLETVLKHWGYRVTGCGRSAALNEQLLSNDPDLLLIGPEILDAADQQLQQRLRELQSRQCPVILLEGSAENRYSGLFPRLHVPIDLFQLFALVQQHLENHPRRNFRLDVTLPGLFSNQQSEQLTEVLSISSQGLFIRTSRRLDPGERCRLVLPLLGSGKELELDGRILYQVDPTAANNYRQGLGIEFVDLKEREKGLLLAYLERELMEDLVDNSDARPLDLGQLQLQPSEGD